MRQPLPTTAPTPPPIPTHTVEMSQFLTDVLTAAGLLANGKQDKKLAERLAAECMRIRGCA